MGLLYEPVSSPHPTSGDLPEPPRSPLEQDPATEPQRSERTQIAEIPQSFAPGASWSVSSTGRGCRGRVPASPKVRRRRLWKRSWTILCSYHGRAKPLITALYFYHFSSFVDLFPCSIFFDVFYLHPSVHANTTFDTRHYYLRYAPPLAPKHPSRKSFRYLSFRAVSDAKVPSDERSYLRHIPSLADRALENI
jgi:hypothetical protein